MNRFHFTSSLGLQRVGSGNKITQGAATLGLSFPLMVGEKHVFIENVVMGFFFSEIILLVYLTFTSLFIKLLDFSAFL